MPYIKKKERKLYEPELTSLCKKLRLEKKGDLTYLVYALAKARAIRKGRSYTNISDSVSCLNDAAGELRRRELFPYEDVKIDENGDVIIDKEGTIIYD